MDVSDVSAGTVMAAGNGAEYDFDLFTIGGGTAGVRAARLSANLGGQKFAFHTSYLG